MKSSLRITLAIIIALFTIAPTNIEAKTKKLKALIVSG
jgi:hypothetical protein